MEKIQVLVVDDSAVIRQVLTEVINADSSMEVYAAVADPIFAMKRMQMKWPDVIVLDVEMPRMDGITFLRQVMDEHPTPVVICSTLTDQGAETTMQAVSAGAVEIIAKPKVAAKAKIRDEANIITRAVKSAAKANLSKLRKSLETPAAHLKPADSGQPQPKLNADVMLPATGSVAMKQTTQQLVAIGTSTGGTQALEHILVALPRVAPGILIVQHMPEKFTAAFAQRLNTLAAIEVKEAADGDKILPGRALIAPGGLHMMLKRSGAQYYVEIKDGPLVSRHRPSVDVLFRSVAKAAGKNAMGIILTGMGDDGAHGMKELHDCGARTLAQDEATSVVYGMPKEALKLGGVDLSIALPEIPAEIMKYAEI